MMEQEPARQPSAKKLAKGEREKMLTKLISQPCVKKEDESCASKDAGGRNTDDVNMRLASSAEILQNMRRDSGASGDDKKSVLKYSRGSSVTEKHPAEQEEQILKIRPDLSDKFRPGLINQLIETTIKDFLADKEYSASEAQNWTKTLTESIQQKTKEHNFARYKLVACVVLGERRGQGLSSAYRCLWDSEADCAASYTFTNDTLYCIGMVFGVYFY